MLDRIARWLYERFGIYADRRTAVLVIMLCVSVFLLLVTIAVRAGEPARYDDRVPQPATLPAFGD